MVLYHASQLKNLTIIKPQRTLSHDKYIGDFVFATKNRRMAVMYLTPRGFPTLMNPGSAHPNIVICGNGKDFRRRDRGGAIYEVPGDTFAQTPQAGLSDYEMVSQQAVRPTDKTVYSSTLQALISENIAVRFVDEVMFKKLLQNPDQQASMIERLEAYTPPN